MTNRGIRKAQGLGRRRFIVSSAVAAVGVGVGALTSPAPGFAQTKSGPSSTKGRVVICPSMIYGEGRGLHPDSEQIPKLIALSRQVGAGVYFGKGLNRYSNVHIDDLVDLYLLVMEKAPGGSFFFAENGQSSFKDLAELISFSLGFGGAAVSLPVEEVIRQHGEAARLGVASNSFVNATNARRLGWSPRAPSLAEWFKTLRAA